MYRAKYGRSWPYFWADDVRGLMRQSDYWVANDGTAHYIRGMSLDYVANALAWLRDNCEYVAKRAIRAIPDHDAWPLKIVITDALDVVTSSPLYRALESRLEEALAGAGASPYHTPSNTTNPNRSTNQ